MFEIHAQAPACNTPAPLIVDLIPARRFRLLIDLDYSPELAAEILNNPPIYHAIVGARDPGNGNPQREAA